MNEGPTGWLASYPQYLQLLGVGFVWINLHCAGMCGPIVVGLDLGGHLGKGPGDTGPGQRIGGLRLAFLNLLLYQLGRSLTYAAQGALAGWIGQALQQAIQSISRVTGLVMALILIVAGLLILLGVPAPWIGVSSSRAGRALGRLVSWSRSRSGPLQRLMLGVVLGFLPCMIPIWTLGLAASTMSPLHGALLMVLLVWLTSGIIFGFGLAPALAPQQVRRARRFLFPVLLILSGLWMGLISAGANGWIDHLSIGLSLRGKGYTIMFW